MSLPRYAARRDGPESEIVSAFRACGFSVEPISRRNVPDLLVGRLGITRVIEVKRPGEDLSDGQREWWAGWLGNPPIVVESVEDVAKLARCWLLLDSNLVRQLFPR